MPNLTLEEIILLDKVAKNKNLNSEEIKLDIIPFLKTLEPYKLEALILEDIKYNGASKLSEIKSRIPEVPEKDIQKAVYKLAKENIIQVLGGNRNRTYELSKKK